MPRCGGRSAMIGAALALSGCAADDDSPLEPDVCEKPVVTRSAVTNNPLNVLSAFVVSDVQLADSVLVRFGVNTALDSATPAFASIGDSTIAPILGLQPATTYQAQLVARNRCGATTGGVLSFTTETLPADLPTYVAAGSAPSPGYVVISAGNYGLVIDNTGRVVWYHRFPAGPGLNFQAQSNGRYAARPPTPLGGVPSWVEIAPTGALTRTLGCAHGCSPRMHDLLVERDGSYWMLCDEIRTVDLSAQGASQTRVLGTAVQRRNPAGDILFEWSPFDHLEIELDILDAVDRSAAVVNWTHGNALDLDSDGNLLISFRNLSEVTKVDTRTGAVLWRMGGVHNEFAFENTATPPFARQHGVRAIGGGRLLLLDNLGQSFGSRAERYDIDGARRTARLSGSYTSAAGLIAQVGGTTQALADGHTLVSFGSGGGVEEYDAAGAVVWKLMGNPGYVFRAQRIRSLYYPGVGDPR